MTDRAISRRRLLQLGAAGTATVVAGCSGVLEARSEEPPAYADWIPADDGKANAIYVDLAGYPEPERVTSEDASVGDIEDPLLGLPLVGLFAGFLSLVPPRSAGLGPVLGLAAEERDEGVESRASELVAADGTAVLTGDIDPVEAGELIRAAPESEFAPAWEPTDGFEGYDVYEQEDDGKILAVEDGTVVSGEREGVEALVGVGQGERARAVEEFEPFGSLLGATLDRLMTFALYDEEGLDDRTRDGDQIGAGFAEAEGALGLVSGMDLSPESGEITAEMALEFDELEADREQTLQDALGSAGADVDVETEDDRFTATATYDETDVSELRAGGGGGERTTARE